MFFRILLAILLFKAAISNAAPSADTIPGVLTNAFQVRELARSAGNETNCSVHLQGIVLWVSSTLDSFIFQDDSGGIVVNADLRKQPVQEQEEVLIEGNCLISHGGVLSQVSINNDGIHGDAEKSMVLYLPAGLHPVSLEWFNNAGHFSLNMDWMEPGQSRQRVPDTVLFRDEPNHPKSPVPGLNYACYEGNWDRLPNFSQLVTVKQGSVSNFDIAPRARDNNVGLVFTGYLRVAQSGTYTFWLTSDDGSKLYWEDLLPRVRVLGPAEFPEPLRFVPGEPIQEYRWAETEGVVTAVDESFQCYAVELTSGVGRAHLKVAGKNNSSLKFLLHSRIKSCGVSQIAFAADGQQELSLLVPDSKKITVMELDPAQWTENPLQSIHSLLVKELPVDSFETIAHISGTVRSKMPDGSFIIEDETGQIAVETATTPNMGETVEVLGVMEGKNDKAIVRNGFYREMPVKSVSEANALPQLTKAIQVINLGRAEAQRGYPVKLRGIVTGRVGTDFFMQDSTWSIYVGWNRSTPREEPKIGEYWEIEGSSSVHFAPDILADRAVYLGPGNLPDPIHPTWDELVNGSLATRYVEIQGIATDVRTNGFLLLTRQGKINLQLQDLDSSAFKDVEGALIRVRGVGSPDRDNNQMMLTALRLFNVSISVDEPAPLRPFDLPTKRVSDLLHFDVRANALRRVKIAGQVLHEHQGEYFFTDGMGGFRVKPKEPMTLHTGVMAEVVGFPDLSGPSPVLREAVVRTNETRNLPAPRHLSESDLLKGELDATLVTVESRLVALSEDNSDQILALQTGTRSFVARLAKERGLLAGILPGSKLGLTGVYAGKGGDRASSRDIDSFELLMNSPADIQVLARPSWWTLRHSMMVIGAMIMVILFAMVWITQLRRQVEERSLQLAAEIKGREQAERQRALEEERTRIAKDLHDDLGATLTEIRFLSAVKSTDASVPQSTRVQLTEVSEKSSQLITSLDEIVWAVNPANDSLPSLANYLCHVTEEFFRNTTVRCRLDVDESLPAIALNSEMRHNLYLCIREAMNNVGKHSNASEVWLRIQWKEPVLHISVEDNGCGFNGANGAMFGNGLSNMHHRLEKIGGKFTCEAGPAAGTVCRISLPLTTVKI